LNTCTDCGLPFQDALDDVACDGCYKFFHRTCLNYCVIDVEWDDMPKAFAFCEECDDGPME